MNDEIVKPNHYTFRGVECNDLIKSIDVDYEEIGDLWECYAIGCVIKYLYRYPMKGTPLKDLMKARQYLTLLDERNNAWFWWVGGTTKWEKYNLGLLEMFFFQTDYTRYGSKSYQAFRQTLDSYQAFRQALDKEIERYEKGELV